MILTLARLTATRVFPLVSWAGSQSQWRVERKNAPTIIGTNWEWRKSGRGSQAAGWGGERKGVLGRVIEVDGKVAIWTFQRRRETECDSCEYLLLKVKRKKN